MKHIASPSLSLLLLLAAACSDSTASLPPGSAGSPLKSPCDGSKALLLRELQLRCDLFPPSPESGNPFFWGSERPSCVTKELLIEDAPPPETKSYDYSAAYTFSEATYDGAGNIATWVPSAYFAGGDPPTVSYDYAGDRLVAVRISGGPLTEERRYEIRYDGDLRIAERIDDRDVYLYTYDDGQLVAEGLPVNGMAPVRYEESMLAPGADGKLPLTPAVTADGDPFGASIASETYFYDGDGRVRLMGFAGAPGLRMQRLDLTYDGDRLTSLELSDSDSAEPSFRAQRWTYRYDGCN